MNEVPQESPMEIVSREVLMTELGAVAKVDLVFNGSSFTVYFTGPTNNGLQALVEGIVSAEESAKDPIVVGIGEKTREQFIENESNAFIDDLRANQYSPKRKGRQSVLDPLVKQRAMKKLFDSANKTNQTQS